MAKYLFTADWHLTSRDIDSYRWELFPWLKRQITNRGITHLFMLGDLTDLKDHHPAALVNRLADNLKELSFLAEVWILSGNHDYSDAKNPFFRFLNQGPKLNFIHKPGVRDIGKHRVLFLPHTKRWRSEWGLAEGSTPEQLIPFKGHDFVLLHFPLIGAVTESGRLIEEGVSTVMFDTDRVGKRATVIAGDIHVPQKVGNVTYCGSPYPVHFGDNFQPRVLLWEDGVLTSLKRSCLRKTIVTGSDAGALVGLEPGDMVRVRLQLPRAEFIDWQKRKREVEDRAEELGVTLCGIEVKEKPPETLNRVRVREAEGKTGNHLETFQRFCEERGIETDLIRQGKELLR